MQRCESAQSLPQDIHPMRQKTEAYTAGIDSQPTLVSIASRIATPTSAPVWRRLLAVGNLFFLGSLA
jgi:hypothetical protein